MCSVNNSPIHISVFLLAVLLAGCSNDKAPHADLIDVDLPEPLRGGEQIAVNLDEAKTVELMPDRTIGSAEDTTGLFLAKPTDVVTVGDSIYIADTKQHAIFVADAKGRLVRRIGRKGQAPGEFIEPVRITANDRFIFVYGHGNHRIQVFDHQFNYVESIPHGFLPLTNAIVADNKHLFLPESARDSMLVSVHAAIKPFKRKRAFMPRLVPPGPQQPMAHNQVPLYTDGSTICSAYIGLPYVFCLNDRFISTRTLVFKGTAVDRLNNPIPDRIQFSGSGSPNQNSTAVRSFVEDMHIFDGHLFLARDNTVLTLSMETGQLQGTLILPTEGYIHQIHVDDNGLLIVMRGKPTMYLYDVARILNHFNSEESI